MSDNPTEERRRDTIQTISALIGSQGRAGLISKETIATALAVSESTVSRWARGDGVPDDKDFLRLRWLYRQRRTWHLRFADFVLAMWTPLGDGDGGADDLEQQLTAGQYLSEITYKPTANESIVECVVKLAVPFRSLTLIVLGPRRHLVELAHSEDGPGGRTLSFDRRIRVRPREAAPTLRKGSTLRFYLRYVV
ncbi:MAG: hypothetical protein KC619_09255 [Myxococcales bacterium]|nr:hypothetical protein [Myxococcales bacterium]